MESQNIFNSQIPLNNVELENVLLSHPKAKIKKIISPAHFKSEIFCQDVDEWVCLVQGEASLQVGRTIRSLKEGDWLFIKANVEHQITSTSANPLAIWLAVYL